MKRIKKLGWSKYVKISIEKERMKKEKKFGGHINDIVGIMDVEVEDEEGEDEEIWEKFIYGSPPFELKLSS